MVLEFVFSAKEFHRMTKADVSDAALAGKLQGLDIRQTLNKTGKAVRLGIHPIK